MINIENTDSTTTKTRKNNQRYDDTAAFFLAPYILPAILFVVMLFVAIRDTPFELRVIPDFLGGFIGVSFIMLVIAYFGLFVWGLPVIFLLRRYKLENPFSYAFCGWLPVPLIIAIDEYSNVLEVCGAGLPGLLVAVAFYWLTRPVQKRKRTPRFGWR